jgi:preprotein translocase subunit SecD
MVVLIWILAGLAGVAMFMKLEYNEEKKISITLGRAFISIFGILAGPFTFFVIGVSILLHYKNKVIFEFGPGKDKSE